MLSIKGFTGRLEPYLWFIFGIIASTILARNVAEDLFIHAFIIGVLWGVINGCLQSLFLDQYLINNPQYADMFKRGATINPRLVPILSGVVIGLVTGLVLFAMTWITKKMM